MSKRLPFFRAFSLFAMLSVFVGGLQAQTTITIGTGTDAPTSNNSLWAPVYRTNSNTVINVRSNTLFTQEELAAAGLPVGVRIDSLQYYKTNANNFLVPATYRLYMGNSNRTSAPAAVWQDIIDNQALVLNDNAFNIPAAIGWVTIKLTTPFYYTGGSLEIATDMAMTGSGGATGPIQFQYTLNYPNQANMVVGGSSTVGDNIPALNTTGAAPKNRANIKIGYSLVPCTGTVDAGTAISSQTIICNAESFKLNISGNSISSDQTYQWQVSTNNSNWTNIDSAGRSKNPMLDTTQMQTSYYRCHVYCGASTDVSDVVMVQSPSLIPATTYTINRDIPASASNFQSFADAINAIKCGISGPVVFNVVPGVLPYTGSTIIPQIPGASATNTITFNGNGATVKYSTYDVLAPAAFMFMGADHIIMDSLTLDCATSGELYAVGMLFTQQADSNIIRRCHFMGSSASTAINIGFAAICFNGSTSTSAPTMANNGNYNLITGNTFENGAYTIYMMGGANAGLNKGNAVTRNKFLNYYSYAMTAYGQEDLLVSENDFSRPSATTGGTYSIIMGDATAIVAGTLIEKNKIHNVFGGGASSTVFYGIRLGSNGLPGKPNRIENNAIYDISGHTGAQYGIYASGFNYLDIYHNTIVLNDATVSTGAVYGIYAIVPTSISSPDVSALNVKNNIVYINRAGTGTKYCLYYGTRGVTSSNNNVLYMGSASGSNNIGFFPAAYTTLAAWKAANAGIYDQASTDVDPMFANMAGFDFKPTAASVASMGAAGTGVTTDIYDMARASNPTPGAIEVSGALPVGMLYFTGETIKAANRLEWSTSSEANNLGFELQRSADAVHFTAQSFIATKAINGNSNTKLTYSYTDAQPLANSWYRLKQTDKNGKEVYSNVLLLKANPGTSRFISSVYPNPAHSELTIAMGNNTQLAKVRILVYDIAGKQVMAVPVNASTGNSQVKIGLQSLQPGTYLLKAVCNSGCEGEVYKFVKQ